MSRTDAPPPWRIEETQTEADYGFFRVERVRVCAPRDDSRHDYHVVDAPDGVTVVALTPGGQVLLVEQFRVPLRAQSLEIPSGVMQDGEAAVAAGLRELREETGYEADDAELLGSIVLNPSWQTTRVHVVLARGARRAAEKELDSGEDTRVRPVSRSELREKTRRGEIASAVSLAALLLWEQRAGPGDGA